MRIRTCVMMQIPMYGLLSVFLLLHSAERAHADETADFAEPTAVTGTLAQELPEAKGLHGLLGAGVIGGMRIVGEKNEYVLPVPLVFLTYSDWAYWNFLSGGVWPVQSPDHSMRLGIGIKVRPGWRPGDDALLSGMSDRRTSIDGAVNALWKTPFVTVSASYYHDILGVYDGDSAMLRVSRSIQAGPRAVLIPALSVEWQSNRLVNYYYGVSDAEATTSRPAYQGHDTVNVRAGLFASYGITRSWSLLGGCNVTRLGDGVSDSPIVLNRYVTFGFLGAGWRF